MVRTPQLLEVRALLAVSVALLGHSVKAVCVLLVWPEHTVFQDSLRAATARPGVTVYRELQPPHPVSMDILRIQELQQHPIVLFAP